ncbi:hypothetical protein ACOCEA_03540 [Maribacter sp. CXY002]|uniref:hypothetical protein n=1 Tax=Maribacter luteocoastalis TaxID=3407671 RepID=UPI003B66CB6F
MKSKIQKNMENKVQYYVYKTFKILFFILLGIGIAFLVGYIFMRLWNWIMPDLFGVPELSYWKAVGALILAKIIFGFGGGNGPGKGKKSKKRFESSKCSSMRKDFKDWKHYDEFWKEEGEQLYNNYLERKNQD